MSETLIRCENIGKKFCRDLKRSMWYGIQDSVADLLGGRRGSETLPNQLWKQHGGPNSAEYENGTPLRPGEFWASKDINFELKRGECLGLIGHNGAGKTTLLKMLNGLIKPDIGRIELRGRVGALIALGAGFSPVLTGRENVFVNSLILGRTQQETRDAFDEIVAFAELEDAIDAPVRTYSSGMQVRLGFAIAAQLSTDVLLVDEVLAVGDNAFQKKCYDRIYELRQRGTSFIVVSHNPYQLERLCDSVATMSDGRILTLTNPKDAIHFYHTDLRKRQQVATRPAAIRREGTQQAVIRSVQIVGSKSSENPVQVGDKLQLVMNCEFMECLKDVRFRFAIFSDSNVLIANISSNSQSEEFEFQPGEHRVIFSVGRNLLLNGAYTIDGIIAQSTGLRIDTLTNASAFSIETADQQVTDQTGGMGLVYTPGTWSIEDPNGHQCD